METTIFADMVDEHERWSKSFMNAVPDGKQMQIYGEAICAHSTEYRKLASVALIDCRISDCSFVKCEFHGAQFFRTQFHNCSFRHCSFIKAELQDAAFSAVKLIACDFTRAELHRAALVRADLTASLFVAATMFSTDIRDAILDHVSFDQAYLDGALVHNMHRYRGLIVRPACADKLDISAAGDGSEIGGLQSLHGLCLGQCDE